MPYQMKEKGENIATKKDLRQSTEIEQEVKEDFNKRLERSFDLLASDHSVNWFTKNSLPLGDFDIFTCNLKGF